jgi:hypothetical protein
LRQEAGIEAERYGCDSTQHRHPQCPSVPFSNPEAALHRGEDLAADQ